jgi:hypothetical protein
MVIGHEDEEQDLGILSWLYITEDNIDEEVELLQDLPLESAAGEAYLDELAQQEEINILLKLDKESCYEERTLIHLHKGKMYAL